jgi:DNA-binding NarL/FixJ family response regulator
MKIIVADDHALFLDGLRHVLAQLTDDPVLIEASDHISLAAAVTQHPDADLAVVDLGMPGGEPFTALETLLVRAPTLPVVVISASENPDDMRRVLDAGAMGYIPKRESAAVMLSALRLVLAGGVYVAPMLMRAPGNVVATHKIVNFTPRQRDVLKGLAAGKSNKEIGRELGMSEATVKAHLSAIFRALGVSNRTQAARSAASLGLTAGG